MPTPLDFENIEEMRKREGIDDVELRDEIRELRVGDLVRLTLLTGAKTFAGESVVARITAIRGRSFLGLLANKGSVRRLPKQQVETPIAFTADHIHSIPRKTATP